MLVNFLSTRMPPETKFSTSHFSFMILRVYDPETWMGLVYTHSTRIATMNSQVNNHIVPKLFNEYGWRRQS